MSGEGCEETKLGGRAMGILFCTFICVCSLFRLFLDLTDRRNVCFAIISKLSGFKLRPFWTLFDRFPTFFKPFRKINSLRVWFREASDRRNLKNVCFRFSQNEHQNTDGHDLICNGSCAYLIPQRSYEYGL